MLMMSVAVKPAFINTVSESNVRLMTKAEAVPPAVTAQVRIASSANRARILRDVNSQRVFPDFMILAFGGLKCDYGLTTDVMVGLATEMDLTSARPARVSSCKRGTIARRVVAVTER